MEAEIKGTLEEKEDLLTIEADHRWAMELIRKNADLDKEIL
jgi:hypothetical protein